LKRGTGNGYDPLEDLVVAQSERPESLRPVNLRTLAPYLRVALTIDGTVTKFIEAFTMEPVDIVRIRQEERALDAEHHWLETPAGSVVTARETLLRGRYSRRLYVYATSLIVPARLPEAVNARLEEKESALGRALIASRFETYREVLWYGREEASGLPPECRSLEGKDVLSRTYRIFGEGRPVMLVNEKFPIDCDWVHAGE